MTSDQTKKCVTFDLSISNLGTRETDSPLTLLEHVYIEDTDTVMYYPESSDILPCLDQHTAPPVFEQAGPRRKIFFVPSETVCGIVTCGGLCPGLNDVIRSVTLTALLQYGVKKVLGFCFGYEGVSSISRREPVEMTPDTVKGIQHEGGSILGAGRGPQDPSDVVETLLKYQVNVLFVVGGDGTFRGAHDIAQEIRCRGLNIAVVGVPKTIDNDIVGSETSFGFGTSVDEARKVIACAHNEAQSAYNGIGLVKLMGRDSGFIAAHASLANSDVNFCLIPEDSFGLEGDDGLLAKLERRLARRGHAVIVTSEGAGQNMLNSTGEQDASGNVRYADVGLFLKDQISSYLKGRGIPFTLKYMDPSYTIRSCAANARDSLLCLMLGRMAVHAGMAGKTDLFVGFWSQHFTHVPFTFAVNKRKKLNTNGLLWQTLLAITDH